MGTSKFYEISNKRHIALRLLSAMIDFALVELFVIVFYFVLHIKIINSLLFAFAISTMYFGMATLLFEGQTLGSLMTKMTVIQTSETGRGWRKLVRVLIISVNFLPFVQFVSIPANIFLTIINPNKMIHDICSSTICVYKFSVFNMRRQGDNNEKHSIKKH